MNNLSLLYAFVAGVDVFAAALCISLGIYEPVLILVPSAACMLVGATLNLHLNK